jgi:hypothetical protein
MNTYKSCGKQYYYKYVEKIPEPMGSPLIFGSAIDEGLNHLLEGKGYEKALEEFTKVLSKALTTEIVYSKKDPQIHLIDADCKQYLFNDGFDVAQVEKASLEKQSTWIQSLPEEHKNLICYFSMLKRGELFLKEYEAKVLPIFKKVLSIQYRIETENNSYSFIGIVDFVALVSGEVLGKYIKCDVNKDYVVLFDNKTASAAYKSDSVYLSEQLGIYSEFLNVDYCGYIVLNKYIKKDFTFDLQVIVGNVDNSIQNKSFVALDHVAEAIQANVFEKNKKSCYNFGRQCPYYNKCWE